MIWGHFVGLSSTLGLDVNLDIIWWGQSSCNDRRFAGHEFFQEEFQDLIPSMKDGMMHWSPQVIWIVH
jgi:hypothetical protein